MSTTKTNHIQNIKNIANDAWCDVNNAIEEIDGIGFTDFIAAGRVGDTLSDVLEKLASIEERCKLLLAMQGIEVEDE